MTLEEIITELNLNVLTQGKDFAQITPSGGYTADLLSCVMAGAKRRDVWITLQAHLNIVAIAALLDLSAIIITEGATPDLETIAKANEEGVILLSTNRSTFYVAGRLGEVVLRNG